MTGFGLAKFQSTNVIIEVSIRSVNGRFFEPRFHMPREYVAYESDLKKTLSSYFQRGTVDIFVSRKVKSDSKTVRLHLNEAILNQYISIANKVSPLLEKKAAGGKKAKAEVGSDSHRRHLFSIESALRLPEVLHVEQETEVNENEWKNLLKTFEKACDFALKERVREGASLKKDMTHLLQQLEREIETMSQCREEANAHLQERFEAKIKSKGPNIEWDSSRVTQEVVLQLEKADINEELSRLKEHIKNYRHLIMGEESQGKKMDFYTQELLREVNTIGSKSNLSKLTQSVVEAKTYVERLREQVQNAE